MSDTGILIIVHGSSNPQWVREVDEAVKGVKGDLPLEVGHLEFSKHETLEHGIRKLEGKGVKVILAVPLFVSSASTHISEIKYVLGLISAPGVETDLRPVSSSARFVWVDPMDAHPLILEIIIERIFSLSEGPEEEVLLLAAHGSDEPDFHQKWEKLLEEIKHLISLRIPFHDIIHGTLLPDNLRQKAEQVSNSGRTVIVVPLFLSEGYFTNKVIPEKLKGLSYKWNGKTYLPHPLITSWINEKIKNGISSERQKRVVDKDPITFETWFL
ncbi:sirohydrochlorin chelatase [Alteribacter keqinensis]|uniref:Cobalamin biosynthesis protein CbiX n=1 Tax=Alteribacter keqinensis TaxID=2483800 RepID=A0A3M7TSZ1_9BACI|nr:CbiX/SirB N-terminal domain-containing protein [Alteribacter keqinensis]RNA67453.1 cobalamin biosynthesis protein CbiX [Alteribacter keqinensis]